jgi:hypothetical protein
MPLSSTLTCRVDVSSDFWLIKIDANEVVAVTTTLYQWRMSNELRRTRRLTESNLQLNFNIPLKLGYTAVAYKQMVTKRENFEP